MKLTSNVFFIVTIFILIASSGYAQDSKAASAIDFSDREAIIKTAENFFIGDHTSSVKHKKLSMQEKGAYRYIDRDGNYAEFLFNLDSAEADTSYKEEILSVEIYGKVALVKARLNESKGGHHYKMFTMHKINGKWKITTITWGSGIKL